MKARSPLAGAETPKRKRSAGTGTPSATKHRSASRIEGEPVDPEAVRSSILKQLGLTEEDRWQDPYARGIARLVVLCRQEKVLARMLREGPEGFTGGMSARKYVALTGCSGPTATRDLSSLTKIGALERLPAGGRSTRYVLCLPARSAPS